MLYTVKGDLFESKEKYIAHQCNCVTKRAAHLAYHMFKRFPFSDIYSCREKPDSPGDIVVRGNGIDQRYVIAIFGQYFPGKPKYSNSKKDGIKARQKYFHSGLWKIAQIPDLNSVAFPFGIGCGAAGNNWDIYSQILKNFAIYLEGKADVFVYQLEDY